MTAGHAGSQGIGHGDPENSDDKRLNGTEKGCDRRQEASGLTRQSIGKFICLSEIPNLVMAEQARESAPM
jgi:hypothetical protein